MFSHTWCNWVGSPVMTQLSGSAVKVMVMDLGKVSRNTVMSSSMM